MLSWLRVHFPRFPPSLSHYNRRLSILPFLGDDGRITPPDLAFQFRLSTAYTLTNSPQPKARQQDASIIWWRFAPSLSSTLPPVPRNHPISLYLAVANILSSAMHLALSYVLYQESLQLAQPRILSENEELAGSTTTSREHCVPSFVRVISGSW